MGKPMLTAVQEVLKAEISAPEAKKPVPKSNPQVQLRFTQD